MWHNLVNSPFIRAERVEMRRIGQNGCFVCIKRKREGIFWYLLSHDRITIQ